VERTRALARASLARHATLSNVRKFTGAGLEVVEDGWHFTSLGGAAAMERKLRSYSHVELDIPYFRDRRRLEATYTTNEDMQWLPLDDRFPPALRENARWRPFVWDGPAAVDGAPAASEGTYARQPWACSRPRAGVAVVADNDGAAWHAAAQERFGAAFAGALDIRNWSL